MLDSLPSAPLSGDPLIPATAPDMNALLGDLARQNPNLALIAQMMAAQRQQADAALPAAVDDPAGVEITALNEELAQARARHARLQRVARRLADELEVARDLLADLAAAFGACGLCWGDDTHCPSCRGRGKPGRFTPDPELRLRFFAQPLEMPAASRTSTPLEQQERR